MVIRKTGSTVSKTPEKRNALTKLLPGYTATMALSSRGPRPAIRSSSSCLTPPDLSSDVTSFKTGRRAPKKGGPSAGKGWFGMRSTSRSEMDEDLEADLALIKHRNYLDPKRFYKNTDKSMEKNMGVLQRGTVVEGAAEFYSSRLASKERKSTLLNEVLHDPSVAGYAQGKFRKMQQAKTEANLLKKKHYGKKRSKRR